MNHFASTEQLWQLPGPPASAPPVSQNASAAYNPNTYGPMHPRSGAAIERQNDGSTWVEDHGIGHDEASRLTSKPPLPVSNLVGVRRWEASPIYTKRSLPAPSPDLMPWPLKRQDSTACRRAMLVTSTYHLYPTTLRLGSWHSAITQRLPKAAHPVESRRLRLIDFLQPRLQSYLPMTRMANFTLYRRQDKKCLRHLQCKCINIHPSQPKTKFNTCHDLSQSKTK